MNYEKPERIQNRKLLNDVASRRCLVNSHCVGRIDPHHITTQGSGGGDTIDNVMPLCRKHHTEWGCGIGKFLGRHPVVRKWLEAHDRWALLDKIDNLNFDLSDQRKKIDIRD